jgi:hypothetical protein
MSCLHSLLSAFFDLMKTIEAGIAMFASKRVQEDKPQQGLHSNPMGSPYKFIASALWALWHHGDSVPLRTTALEFFPHLKHTR